MRVGVRRIGDIGDGREPATSGRRATVILAVTGSNNRRQPGRRTAAGWPSGLSHLGHRVDCREQEQDGFGHSTGPLINATATVNVTPGAPTQIAITTQPSSAAQAGVAFATQPVVQLKDAGGNNSRPRGSLLRRRLPLDREAQASRALPLPPTATAWRRSADWRSMVWSEITPSASTAGR